MSLKDKISSINNTPELINFIKTLGCQVTFWHGRKFYYERNSENFTYNELISQIHCKLQNSQSFDGSMVAAELKQLDSNAEKILSLAKAITRIFTYAKRFFDFSQRKQKIEQIEKVKVTHNEKLPKDNDDITLKVIEPNLARSSNVTFLMDSLAELHKRNELLESPDAIGYDIVSIDSMRNYLNCKFKVLNCDVVLCDEDLNELSKANIKTIKATNGDVDLYLGLNNIKEGKIKISCMMGKKTERLKIV